MRRLSAHCLGAVRGPDRGGALQRFCWALYGSDHCEGCANYNVAKAPARGAAGRSRGGVQARVDSARGGKNRCFALGLRRSEGPTPHAPRGIFAKKKQGGGV